MRSQLWRESRQYKRIKYPIEVECNYDGLIRPSVNRTTDLSGGGMFIDLILPPPPGTVVTVKFRLPGDEAPIEAKSEVRYSEAGVGMGLKFLQINPNDQAKLMHFIDAHA